MSILLTAAAFNPIYYIYYSFMQNGIFGLPFDDAFIHLTFARNISEYVSYSFFKNEMVTSGSSSPVFTFIQALGFFFTHNEFALCYITGILIFVFSAYIFLKLNCLEYKSNQQFLLAAVLIYIFDKRILFFSVSGMETILFAANLLASLYFYRTRKVIPLSISIALSVWIRPEGILFIIAIAADYYFYKGYFGEINDSIPGKLSKGEIKLLISVISASLLLYFIFNLFLSGTIFPNTFYAKKTFYSPEYMSREAFLKDEVWEFFASGSYSFFMFGFNISAVMVIHDLLKRKINKNLPGFIFIMIYISAYWFNMPYSGLNGRYLVPLIPFYLMISISGYNILFIHSEKLFNNRNLNNTVKYFLLLVCAYLTGNDLNSEINLYSKECRSNQMTHIDAANWLKQNTLPEDIIATHEAGAIGFYSQRRIVDIVGIVSPELIDKLSDENYITIMQKYLDERGVKYFATLKNWCRVDNANPVFSSKNQESNSDIFEIFKYFPATTHILSKKVSRSITFARYNLNKKNSFMALYFLNEAVKSDSGSSQIYFLKSEAYRRINDTANTELNLLKAVKLFPDFPAANLQLYKLYRTKNDIENSAKYYIRSEQIRMEINSSENQISVLAGKEAR